jgi:glycosyltransferase involved in cell wall biosynthesis
MNWPSISVVIPSYNQGEYIERALLSVLHQDYPGRVEIIVSDGLSQDQTLRVLNRYPQVTWWSRKDGGVADAINRGLSVATGDVIAIQSSDDFYLRDAFRLTVEAFLADRELGLASGCDVHLQPDGHTFNCSKLDDHEITPRSLLMRRVIPQHCCFFRREVFERIGPLRTCIVEGSEVDFWYRALHYFRGTFVPHHTAAYQIHDRQRSRTGDRWYESLVRMVETCEADVRYGPLFHLSTSDKRDLYARWEILQEHRAGHVASAIELIDRLMQSPECTDETLTFLATHGLIPKTASMRQKRHPNDRVPDFGWYVQAPYQQEDVRAVA